MTHIDHVELLRHGIMQNSGGIWADFGSGEGAFTLALRDIAGPDAIIYSIDKDERSLAEQKKRFAAQFPGTAIHFMHADFSQNLELPVLDGLVAANSIHFQKNTKQTFRDLGRYLKPGGTFLVVEYNTDQGNNWVPYPFSFSTFQNITCAVAMEKPELLATIPSHFLKEIYSARTYTTGD